MKCYRIREKLEFRDAYNPDGFYGGIYDTLRGAKSAISNRSVGYINRRGRDKFEIVEYDMIESKVI